MPTSEEWRRWFRGEKVEGFPDPKKKPEPAPPTELGQKFLNPVTGDGFVVLSPLSKDAIEVESYTMEIEGPEAKIEGLPPFDDLPKPPRTRGGPIPLGVPRLPEDFDASVIFPGGLGEGARVGDLVVGEDGEPRMWTGSEWAILPDSKPIGDTWDHEALGRATMSALKGDLIPGVSMDKIKDHMAAEAKRIVGPHARIIVDKSAIEKKYIFTLHEADLELSTSMDLPELNIKRAHDPMIPLVETFKALIRAFDECFPPCERCRSRKGVKKAPVMTAYEWDGKGKDPNDPPMLCPECLEEWVEGWEDQWREYYSGRL